MQHISTSAMLRTLLLTIVLVAHSSSSTAQTWQAWGPDDYDKLSFSNADHVSMAVNNGTPYVAYNSGGTHVKKLKADGSGWEQVGVAMFSGPGSASLLSLAFSGNMPYVVYRHSGTSNRGILKRFDGTTWETVGGAPFSTGDAAEISMIMNATGQPYILYKEAGQITLKKFDGTAWQTIGSPGFATGDNFSFTLDGNTPYVAFRDHAASFAATVMKFNGTVWETVGTPGFSLPPVGPGQVQFTSMAMVGSTPYVAYISSHVSNKVIVKRFNGTAWENVGTEGFSAGQAFDVTMVVNNGVPYVGYRDNSFGHRATVKKFDGTDWTTVGIQGFSTASAYEFSLAFDGSTPYIAYGSGASTSTHNEAIVMKLNGAGDGWERIGAVTSLYTTDPLSRFVFEGSTPYIYYRETDYKGSVRRFNGSEWEYVGTAGFTAGTINNNLTLTLDQNKVPYVYYVNNDNGDLLVMKFNGTNWENVGSTIANNITPISLVFNSSNAPAMLYRQFSSGNHYLVLKTFDGSGWQTTQSATFSSGSVTYFHAHLVNEVPAYLFYSDPTASSKATVKQFNGSGWTSIGGAGFTSAGISDPFITLINNVPYIAFRDAGASSRVSVMKYNGTSWEFVGPRGFSLGDGSNPELIDRNGKLYVRYNDRLEIFDGTDWVDVGDNTRPYYSTAFHPVFEGDAVIVAYTDAPAADKATVKKFPGMGNSWAIVGNSAFTSGEATGITMKVEADTVMIVYKSYKGGIFARKIVVPNLLPVQLIRYDARKEKEKVRLEWTTASEVNNREFIISRSTDGLRYEQLGRIPGAVSAAPIQQYHYYDPAPHHGKNYYRLDQVDLDGRKTMLGVRVIDVQQPPAVRLFPNPASNQVVLRIPAGVYQSAAIADLTGRLVRSVTIPVSGTSITLMLTGLPPGTYPIILRGAGATHTIRLIKR